MADTRIVIVEDDPVIANLIAIRLKKMGYIVAGIFSTGEEAIDTAEDLRPDLMIMDIRLKGAMDGVETANSLYTRYSIPSVYLTGDVDPETFDRAKRTFDCHFLQKPFTDSDLSIAIELTQYKHRFTQNLKKGQERYMAILRSLTDGVIASDTNGQVTFINPAAEALIGNPPASTGLPQLDDLVILADMKGRPVSDSYRAVIREGHVLNIPGDIVLFSKDRSPLPVRGSVSPLREQGDRVTGLVISITRA